VAARREDGWLVIEVSDRGPGLAPGDETRVFEKFWRAGEAAAPARTLGTPAGTGLGLAICRAIVEAHGGSVEAGRRPGGGARFTLRLPAVETAPESPPAEETTDDRQPSA